MLSQFNICITATEDVKNDVAELIHNYVNELHKAGKYDELTKQVMEMKLSVQIFDVFGEAIQNSNHLEKLKNASTRRKIATKFSIPMDGGKFDTNQEGVTEKIVKILCDKGMVDPFESLPMEVPSAKKWE